MHSPLTDAGARISLGHAMMESPLDRLTRREREALEAFFMHGHRGAAAQALNMSENTLKTHLVSARRKLALPDARIFALLFPAWAGPHPKWASPHRVIDSDALAWRDAEVDPQPAATDISGPLHDMVRVERTDRERWDNRHNDLSTLPRIVLMAVATLAVICALILAFAFNDGLQRWSNTIATPTTR